MNKNDLLAAVLALLIVVSGLVAMTFRMAGCAESVGGGHVHTRVDEDVHDKRVHDGKW